MGWYRFGEFELDTDHFTLKREGVAVPMQPKVFDVLRHLIERRGEVVSKAELLQEHWSDSIVNDSVVAWSISHIRRALGQRRGDTYPIETIAGRGYCFRLQVKSGPLEVPAPPSPTLEAQPKRSGFVGRARVMAELEQRVHTATAGRGCLCLITGEAGIGKTRCAEELLSIARNLHVRTLVGRCPEDTATPPLWPITTALEGLDRNSREFAQRGRELLSDLTEADVSAEGGQASASRFRLIDRIVRLLRDLSAAQATVLVLDDLQWADASSLSLLAFLAPELHEMPLCVVATLRTGEALPSSGHEQSLQRLLRYAQTIPLGTLDTSQVAELMQQDQSRPPSDALAEAVQRASGGVPLFVQEILQTLLLEHGREALLELPPDAVRVPALAGDVLRQRIARLPAVTAELLTQAAVIGERFDLSLLLGMVELEPDALLEQLEPAIAQRQLRSEAPHVYRFEHALFRSVLYADMPAAARVAAHRKIARLLLARTDDERQHGEIARHFYLSLPAGDPAEVVQRAREAGDHAQSRYAHEDAAVYYGWALEAQSFGNAAQPRARAELLLSLAAAQRLAGRTSDAHQTTTRLLELAQQEPMHDLVVRATRLRRPTVAMAMLPDALACSALERVLEPPETASATRVSALSQLACIPPYSRNLTRSKELSARALQMAQELPGQEPLIEALRARLFSLSGPDDIERVLEVADQMLAAEAGGPRSWHSGDAHSARYYAHVLAGQIGRADAVLAQMAADSDIRHWPEAVFFRQRLIAQRRFLDGAFDEAEQLWQVLHRQALRAGVTYADLFYDTHNFNLALEREGARAVMQRRMIAPSTMVGLTPSVRAGLARVAAEAGDHDFARAQLAGLGDPSDHPRDGYYLHLLACLAVCASRISDRPRSEQLYALLAPYAELNTPSQMGYYLGSVSHFLGLLAATLGRAVQAGAHFERALALNRGMGYRPGVVRTLLAHGAHALRSGSQALGRDLLARAAEEARALGMRWAAEEAEAALG